jgi:dethiobiotin synthetase
MNKMTKKIYFITATNTDIGKTKASEVFLNKYAKQDLKVGYFKPIETGVVDAPLDGTKMLNLTKSLNPSFDVSIDEVVPYQFRLPAAPYVANSKSIDINTEDIINRAKNLLEKCDVLIVEGAGGLMVPITQDYFMVDLMKDFQNHFDNCEVVLITPSRLGCINDTLLSQKLLEQYDIEYNWYINLYQDKEEFKTTTLPFYEKYFNQINYL